MTAYQFVQPWLSKMDGDSEPTAREFANLRNYLKGLDDGTISLFNPKLLNATINALTAGGNITMGGFKLTGLGAGSVNGDSLRYEQLIGLYLLLTGGTMSGAIAMGSNKITGLTSASASGDALSWGQAFTSGQITFSPTTTGIKGTPTNDAAAAGNVGEIISSVVTAVSAPTSGQYGDMAHVDLTAGDWDLDTSCVWIRNGATWQSGELGVGTVTGNDPTGLADGSNYSYFGFASTSTAWTQFPVVVPPIRISISASTTYYAKLRGVYSVATPLIYGRISARRWR